MNADEAGGVPGRAARAGTPSTIELTGIAVHWHDLRGIELLASSWPADPRFELLVVDNGSEEELQVGGARVLSPGRNLGFAGAVNLGLGFARGPVALILNSDTILEDGSLESLLEGLRRHPEAAGLAPRLVDLEGKPQYRWQLRSLPSLWTLMLQSLLVPAGAGAAVEPATGQIIEQPAAAALAIRRTVLEEIGGFDELFYPAWFEDVDLAARMRDAGHTILYWRDSRIRHRLGSTVPTLGFRRFLWIYYTNLDRYLKKHYGAGWATTGRLALAPACLLRAVLLPFRKPRRASNRRGALRGLVTVIMGALSNWRFPRQLAATTTPPRRTEVHSA